MLKRCGGWRCLLASVGGGLSLGNFLCTLAAPQLVADELKEKLIKIGAKALSHGRTISFQMAEVDIPRLAFHVPGDFAVD